MTCWHFDNDETRKIDDVLNEHGGLLHVLPLAVQLHFFFHRQVGMTILSKFYSLAFVVGPLLHSQKILGGGGWWVAYRISVSAPVPLVLIGFLNWARLGWGWA